MNSLWKTQAQGCRYWLKSLCNTATYTLATQAAQAEHEVGIAACRLQAAALSERLWAQAIRAGMATSVTTVLLEDCRTPSTWTLAIVHTNVKVNAGT